VKGNAGKDFRHDVNRDRRQALPIAGILGFAKVRPEELGERGQRPDVDERNGATLDYANSLHQVNCGEHFSAVGLG
jgi:hypothetical protein